MRKKNALLLAAVSTFALMTATTATNAGYLCSWTDGVKICGYERGFAPSAGGEANSRDQHSGDHEAGNDGRSDGRSDGDDGGSDGDDGGSDGDDGGSEGDGSPNGNDDSTR